MEVAQISIKRSNTNFEVVTLEQFIKIPFSERISLINEQKVEFIDYQGEKIGLIEGIKAVSEYIKKSKV